MMIDFAVVNKDGYQVSSLDMPNCTEEDYICIYDLFSVAEDGAGIIVDKDYVAFAFDELYDGDNMSFVVFGLNKAQYDKRLAESKNGYHNGMFWLFDDLFSSIDNVPLYDDLCKELNKT